MRITLFLALVLLFCLGLAAQAAAQELSSSLYATGDEFFADPFAAEATPLPAASVPGRQSDDRLLSPAIAAASFTAVLAPAPKTFAVHDMVTIIVREETQTSFTATLETEKESEFTGEIADFPRFQLSDLVDFQLLPNTFPDGIVSLDVTGESEFEGEGDYANQQTLIARLQATIIDVKPNGSVVLEARKSIRSDDEHYTLVATGVCRVDDITPDNHILSTQIADLFIDKQHAGHLKKAADKGLFTQIMDFLFPW
ncbi:MAG: flagellar basal body L-ring protein FlgH [Planctomycetota bacterium]